jgi:hypothetical protein
MSLKSPDHENIHNAARAYLEIGWPVIPLIARTKRPLVRWTEFQNRRPSASELEGWLVRWPDLNIGIVTGAAAGLVVLDIDPKHGGAESLNELEAHHGALPPTVEALTGGGGRHLYFRHPGGTLHNLVGLAAGIDLRGDGGYIVAPPSIHPSGRAYEWRSGHAPGEMPLDFMPESLLRLVNEKETRSGHPLAHWRDLVREGVEAGQRNNTIASFAGHLLWHGVDPLVALELLLCWNRARCQPPLSDDEVARTVESITKLHQREERQRSG